MVFVKNVKLINTMIIQLKSAIIVISLVSHVKDLVNTNVLNVMILINI